MKIILEIQYLAIMSTVILQDSRNKKNGPIKSDMFCCVESGRLLDRACPGCGKVLSNMKNLFRHLEVSEFSKQNC